MRKKHLSALLGLVSLLVVRPALSQTTSYTYDDLGRVKTASLLAGPSTAYTYDNADNRLSVTTTPPGYTIQDRLLSGQALFTGNALWSTNGLYELIMQTDANLVLYGPNGALWSSATNGTAQKTAYMRPDGNFIIYGPANQIFWNSATSGNPGSMLVMQTDGNVVVYNAGGTAVWNSHTSEVAPVANNDTATTQYQTAINISALANDTDGNGDPLIITGVGAASHGSTSYTASYATYTPNAGYSGSDAFSYSISDKRGGTASATIGVTVQAQASPPPVCNNFTYTFPIPTNAPPQPVSISAANFFTANCSSSSGYTLSVTSPALPLNFTIAHGQSLPYSYSVSDGHGGTASATVTFARQ